MSATLNTPAAITRLSLPEALARGPAEWDAVQAQVERPSPFMSWAWHRAWAQAAPESEVAASEVLVLRGASGAVGGLLPVLLRRHAFRRVPVRALTWAIGDLCCPDHLDLLAPATPDADVAAFWPAIQDLPWDVVVLSNVSPDAPALGRLCEAAAADGHAVRRQPLWGCPYLDLADDWDRYLATLTPNRRQSLRRKERALKRDHAVAITDYAGDRLDEGLKALFELHEQRWGGEAGGAFREPSARRLHHCFASELAARDQLWLTTLDVDGQPAAAWYGFTCGDTVYFYQSGRNPRWERESIGQILMGLMIRRAIERGYRRFDFLRGEDDYKRHWTGTTRFTEEITIFKPGWGGRLLRALDTAADLRARLHA